MKNTISSICLTSLLLLPSSLHAFTFNSGSTWANIRLDSTDLATLDGQTSGSFNTGTITDVWGSVDMTVTVTSTSAMAEHTNGGLDLSNNTITFEMTYDNLVLASGYESWSPLTADLIDQYPDLDGGVGMASFNLADISGPAGDAGTLTVNGTDYSFTDLTDIPGASWSWTVLDAIDGANSETVVWDYTSGDYRLSTVFAEFGVVSPSQIPEPSSLILIGLGSLGLISRRRR